MGIHNAVTSPDTREPNAASTQGVHALIDKAVVLYDNKRYRDALALCDQVARLDPSAALPEIMRAECRRRLGKRGRRAAALAAASLVVLAGLWYAYAQLASIRPDPSETELCLDEMQQQVFTLTSGFGRHEALEFTWTLLDENAKPVSAAEQTSLRHERNAPWSCVYEPTYGAVKAAAADQICTRRIVAAGTDTAGNPVVEAQWNVRVRHVPRPPEILGLHPSPIRRIAIAPGARRTFRVDALDGDGAADLDFKWFLCDANSAADTAEPPAPDAIVGTEPAWTFTRPPKAAAAPNTPTPPVKHVVCRIANRAGEPFTHTLTWVVHLVALNRPPEIAGTKPHFRDVIPIHSDKKLSILAAATDLDADDTLDFQWQLDGDVISVTEGCTLVLPPQPEGQAVQHTLRLIVTDSCGAQVERTWRLVDADR